MIMLSNKVGGYVGKILRVDLTSECLTEEHLNEATLRKWLGGDGLGAKYLYEEVLPGVESLDPENRLIVTSGPLGGTSLQGSGTFSVVTKNCISGGASTSQANGFFGAFMKFSGFDGFIVQGSAKRWLYLYLHDGVAELRDASHLIGKDTVETEDLIRKELGKRKEELSVFSIGPAGENLVKFAAILGDRGHAVGRNGVVMGSKKLKAFAAARGKGRIEVKNARKVSTLAKELLEILKDDPVGKMNYLWGTSALFTPFEILGKLPVKNLSSVERFPAHAEFMGEYYRPRFEIKPKPCWACKLHHLHTVKMTEGPYAGMETEEPEFEQMAMFGPQIGQSEPGAAIMLSNVADRLGLEAEEAGRVIGLAMECYEKGILTKKKTDDLEMTWGNVEAAKTLLYKIANREGFGNVLAEGTLRAAKLIGGKAPDLGVYTMKGLTLRGSDPRVSTSLLFDMCVSNTGHSEIAPGPVTPEFDLPVVKDIFSPEEVTLSVVRQKARVPFVDSLGVCFFSTNVDVKRLCQILSAATGWNFTFEEATEVGKRIVNLLRVFNIRHGHTPDLDAPSPRLAEPVPSGPSKGKTIGPAFNKMRRLYYEEMGWDPDTSRPLPETLKSLGLGYTIPDIWGKEAPEV